MTLSDERLHDLTRPIIGIENRTSQEAFDIMCDRIRSALTTSPSRNDLASPGSSAEPLAFLGPDGLPSPPERFPQPWRDDPAKHGLIPLYEHPPSAPPQREGLEEALTAVMAKPGQEAEEGKEQEDEMMNQYPTDDNQFEDSKITEVSGEAERGWWITKADGWSFLVPKDSPIAPAPGMSVRMYGRGIGAPVRGLFLDGQKVYYRTEDEDRDHHNAESYGKDAAEWLARWDAGETVWSVEMSGLGPGYEQAIQVTAAEVLRWLLTDKPDFATMDADEGTWNAWCRRRDEALFAVPGLSELGLSGAQYGAACNIATILYRRGPIAVLTDDTVKDRKIQVRRDFPRLTGKGGE